MGRSIGSEFICQTCGYLSLKWVGKCPSCEEWNSIVETEKYVHPTQSRKSEKGNLPKKINDVTFEEFVRDKTGIEEFDRVLGGGITKGSLILVGGAPGVGKTTLLTIVMREMTKFSKIILYISGEESSSQVAQRARRVGVTGDNYYILHESDINKIVEEIKKLKPDFVVIDSIQTITSDELTPGSLTQVRNATHEILNVAKDLNITCFIIGHVTKEGAIAGPKMLEHMVDTVVYFDGDESKGHRILRAIKNRFGSINEVGIFEMDEGGLKEVADAAKYFIDDGDSESFGRSTTSLYEGSRPLFVEIQSLVVENKFGSGRRSANGVDLNRLTMMVAVVEKYFETPLVFHDVFINAVGGIKQTSRDSDLAIIASLLSSYKSKSIPRSTIFLGEVGLTGEIRPIGNLESRINEAERLKFRKVVMAEKNANDLKGKYSTLEIIGIKTIRELADLF